MGACRQRDYRWTVVGEDGARGEGRQSPCPLSISAKDLGFSASGWPGPAGIPGEECQSLGFHSCLVSATAPTAPLLVSSGHLEAPVSAM